jgi:hypothetical protein
MPLLALALVFITLPFHHGVLYDQALLITEASRADLEKLSERSSPIIRQR